ncbi:hypothetical protein ACWEWU_14270 [Staphylococcus xylosus]
MFDIWGHGSVNRCKDDRSKEPHAYSDGKFKLIWRDRELGGVDDVNSDTSR